MEKLNGSQVRQMLLCAADRIIESKPTLTEVDSAIGDGDHGIGMALGMEEVRKALTTKAALQFSPYEAFSAAGRAMLMSMGGASGVIFGSLYLGGAKGQSGAEIDAADLAAFFRRSLETIQQRGGAGVGDKTMVDALAPAVEAMEANVSKGIRAMLRAAEAAARQGVENTKQYVARFGRAKSLGERAIGHPDAGAVSVSIILAAMADTVEKAGE